MNPQTSECFLVVRDGDHFSMRYFYNRMENYTAMRGGLEHWIKVFQLNDASSVQKLFKHNKDIYDLAGNPTDEIDDEYYEGDFLFKNWPKKLNIENDCKLTLYDEEVHTNNLSWAQVLKKSRGLTLYVFDQQWNTVLQSNNDYNKCITMSLAQWAAANYGLMNFKMEDYKDLDCGILEGTVYDLNGFDFDPSPTEEELRDALIAYLKLPADMHQLSDLNVDQELLDFVRNIPEVSAVMTKEVLLSNVHPDSKLLQNKRKI